MVLLGTVHFSKQSVEDVSDVITLFKTIFLLPRYSSVQISAAFVHGQPNQPSIFEGGSLV